VLARAITATPPNVVLPAIIGAVGSLNTYVAIVGASGSGKDAALSAAIDAVDFGVPIRTRGIGTGQGIMGQYVKRRKINGGSEDGEDYRNVQVLDRFLLHIAEIHGLKAQATSQGANILSVLTDAWTGSGLGGTYKDEKLDIEVAAHAYRLGVVAGVQPGEAAIRTKNDALGLPQRFVWVLATDASVAECIDPPDWPGTMAIDLPKTGPAPLELDELAMPGQVRLGERVEMGVCASARDQVIADRAARLHPSFDGDPLDSHALLCRLKIAAGLALMSARLEISEEDWALSGIIMAKSRAVRGAVFAHLDRQARTASKAKRDEAVETATAAERAKARELVDRAAVRMIKILGKNPDGLAKYKIRNSMGPPYRSHAEEALEALLESDTILEIDGIFKIKE
jgi:hypothetical protein